MVSDTFPQFAGDALETQLPCSPSQIPNTDLALNTLAAMDKHDEQVLQEAIQSKVFRTKIPIHV